LSPSLDFYAAGLIAVTCNESNRFGRALERLRQLASGLDFPIAIAGGLAGLVHGTGVTTLDIDVVIPSGRADQFAEAAEHAGFRWVRRSAAGWHRLEFDDPEGIVPIECLPAGQNSPRDPVDAPPIPEPTELGVTTGLGYADLPGWVLMKLTAARDKDRYHLGEAIKHWDEAAIASIVQKLRHYPQRYLNQFQKLIQTARDEDSRNW
jgi:hypothetical protein